MDLPWGPPHLVQECSCGEAWACEIRAGYLAFCKGHEARGHKLGGLGVMAFAQLPKA